MNSTINNDKRIPVSNRASAISTETPVHNLRPIDCQSQVDSSKAPMAKSEFTTLQPSLDQLVDLHSPDSSFFSPSVVVEDISNLCKAVQRKELDGQVNNHRADPLYGRDKGYLKSQPENLDISWPQMNEDKKWSAFSDTVMKKLGLASHHLSVGARILFLQTTIYECAHSTFGHKAVVVPRPRVPISNPKHRTIQLVKQKNELLDQIQIVSNPSEKEGL